MKVKQYKRNTTEIFKNWLKKKPHKFIDKESVTGISLWAYG